MTPSSDEGAHEARHTTLSHRCLRADGDDDDRRPERLDIALERQESRRLEHVDAAAGIDV